MHLDFAFYIAMHLEGETWHMPKESGYANRDHGILGSTSRVFFFPSRGFPSRRHHFAR